jgi:hypothetical protein
MVWNSGSGAPPATAEANELIELLTCTRVFFALGRERATIARANVIDPFCFGLVGDSGHSDPHVWRPGSCATVKAMVTGPIRADPSIRAIRGAHPTAPARSAADPSIRAIRGGHPTARTDPHADVRHRPRIASTAPPRRVGAAIYPAPRPFYDGRRPEAHPKTLRRRFGDPGCPVYRLKKTDPAFIGRGDGI